MLLMDQWMSPVHTMGSNRLEQPTIRFKYPEQSGSQAPAQKQQTGLHIPANRIQIGLQAHANRSQAPVSRIQTGLQALANGSQAPVTRTQTALPAPAGRTTNTDMKSTHTRLQKKMTPTLVNNTALARRPNKSLQAWASKSDLGGYYKPTITGKQRTKSLPPRCHMDDRSVSDTTIHSRKALTKSLTGKSWDNFCGQVEMITDGGYVSSGHKQSFARKASDLHNRVVQDMKVKSLRQKTKSIIIHAKIAKAKDYMLNHTQEHSDTDSDDEFEQEMAVKRKAAAQRHWNIIRRDVADKIRTRKENNQASKTWNMVWRQIQAQNHAEKVRLELYIKYGILNVKHPELKPIGKPRLSESAKQLISDFESFHIEPISYNHITSQKK